MRSLSELLREPGRLTISGAPEGRAALALADIRAGAPDLDVVFVARDDTRLSAMAEALEVFAPDAPQLLFPAWDCLPYDRVSPRPDICAQRLHCLSRLVGDAGEPGRLVLTTVNAVLQRVPPRAHLAGAHFAAAAGERLDLDHLVAFLERNGFQRVGTVMEPGEYSLRGGIIDLFAPGTEAPLRLDLFGDELEAIRAFDPLSQRTTEPRERFDLVPVSEVGLDADSVARFRAGYRALFGAVTREDPLYEAVSARRRYPGMEHWLPLFHERLETLLDYLPGAAVVLEHLAEDARRQRQEAIADYHEARRAALEGKSRFAAPAYKPVPPESLFVTDGE
jgi:transcription-repair coupling factor (superfamily II helicase)